MIRKISGSILLSVVLMVSCRLTGQVTGLNAGSDAFKNARLQFVQYTNPDGGTESAVNETGVSMNEDQLPSFSELLNRFELPSRGKVISRFGMRHGRMHTGIDIKCYPGDTVFAAYCGKVIRASSYYGYGNLVVLEHVHGLETYYAHLSSFLVTAGDSVVSGQPLGFGGRTGRATTEHLHFEVREGGKAYNPELLFDFENYSIRPEVTGKGALADFIRNPETGEHFHITSGGNGYVMEMSTVPMVEYVIRAGDSLWNIARRFNTSVAALCELNNLTTRSILRIGSVLKIFGTAK